MYQKLIQKEIQFLSCCAFAIGLQEERKSLSDATEEMKKKQQPKVIVGETTINSVTCDGTTLEVQFRQFSYIALYY